MSEDLRKLLIINNFPEPKLSYLYCLFCLTSTPELMDP